MLQGVDQDRFRAIIDFAGCHYEFDEPVETIAAYTDAEVNAGLLRLRSAASDGLWAAGYIAYDAASAIDSHMRTRAHLFPTYRKEGRAGTPIPLQDSAEGSGAPRLLIGLFTSPRETSTEPDMLPFECSPWVPDTGTEEYASRIDAIHELIAAGQTYQVNYTLRLNAQFSGDVYSLYQAVRRAAGGHGYCAYLRYGDLAVLSLSPEMLFRIDGRAVVVKPMKGTVTRGLAAEDDQARAEWLRTSEKNRAENVMIVDLMRNDLGRICEIGSVRVPELFAIETYATVHQMVSTVWGTLRPDIHVDDVIRALFPSGSVTGAPKISSMASIAALETTPRGVYCGAIGVIKPDGDCVFNVAIRTATIDTASGSASCGVGGGITWDSDAADERREALLKGEFLQRAATDFALLESLLLTDGVYGLINRHLDRLRASAAYFGYGLDDGGLLDAMARHAESRAAGAYKTRLLLHRDGSVHLESSPITPLTGEPLPVAISDDPVSSSDIFLYHKTTHRRVYETRRARHENVFDVLLVNERGELTEFTIGNLVIERDGVKWTPPVACGLLPGTLRAELLDAGEIRELPLHPDDLRSAARIWHINSVRGWTPVRLVDMEG